MTLHINGRFLTQQVSGVQRFARGVLGALDDTLTINPALAEKFGKVCAWYPAGAPLIDPPGWNSIHIEALPGHTGHLWEQTSLGLKARTGPLLGLCGSGPLLCRNQLLVLHDANIWTQPGAFPLSYRTFHRTMRRHLSRRVVQLATVSRHSASVLSECLNVPEARFTVISNSAEHLTQIDGSTVALSRWNLKPKGYFLAVGNQTPNKNVGRLLDAMARLPSASPPLVVVGGFAPGVRHAHLVNGPAVRLVGRVSDGEIKALYRNARAFVWPSLSEGFGIPPLEAMTFGVPVLSSDRTAMPEILGDAPLYFDPDSTGSIAACLSEFLTMSHDQVAEMTNRGQKRAAAFSWKKSANQLLNALEGMNQHHRVPVGKSTRDQRHPYSA